MNLDLTSKVVIFAAVLTIIGTILSTLISSLWASKVAVNSARKQEKQTLIQYTMMFIQVAIEYPYLEDDYFCSNWMENRINKSEQYLRYDNYCCLVFNTLELIWKYCKGKKKDIEALLAVKELVDRHKLWWNMPSQIQENVSGYDPRFRKFIEDNYLNRKV